MDKDSQDIYSLIGLLLDNGVAIKLVDERHCYSVKSIDYYEDIGTAEVTLYSNRTDSYYPIDINDFHSLNISEEYNRFTLGCYSIHVKGTAIIEPDCTINENYDRFVEYLKYYAQSSDKDTNSILRLKNFVQRLNERLSSISRSVSIVTSDPYHHTGEGNDVRKEDKLEIEALQFTFFTSVSRRVTSTTTYTDKGVFTSNRASDMFPVCTMGISVEDSKGTHKIFEISQDFNHRDISDEDEYTTFKIRNWAHDTSGPCVLDITFKK